MIINKFNINKKLYKHELITFSHVLIDCKNSVPESKVMKVRMYDVYYSRVKMNLFSIGNQGNNTIFTPGYKKRFLLLQTLIEMMRKEKII